jgi:hypothetical protein
MDFFVGDAANGGNKGNNRGLNHKRLVEGNALWGSSIPNLDLAEPIVNVDNLVITEKIAC